MPEGGEDRVRRDTVYSVASPAENLSALITPARSLRSAPVQIPAYSASPRERFFDEGDHSCSKAALGGIYARKRIHAEPRRCGERGGIHCLKAGRIGFDVTRSIGGEPSGESNGDDHTSALTVIRTSPNLRVLRAAA